MNTARIICGDVREVLPTLERASFDVAIADPLYGETSLKWDKRVAGWPALVRPLLKPHGSMWCFGSLRSFWATREDFDGWHLAQDLVWEKHNGSNSAADRFRRVHEQLVHFYPADAEWGGVYRVPQFENVARKKQVRRKKRPAHWGEIGEAVYTSEDGGPLYVRSVIYERSCHGHAIHPTEKPLGIQQTVIRYSCPPGGNVLALFAGSGSTLVAALREGRDSLGVEIDSRMVEKASARLADDAPLLNRAEVG